MPPKKNKKKKEDGDGGKVKTPAAPLNFDMYESEALERRKQMEEWRSKYKKVKGDNDELLSEMNHKEKDTMEVIGYLRTEDEKNHSINVELQDRLAQLQQDYDNLRDDLEKEMDVKIQDELEKFQAREDQLLAELEEARRELDDLRDFMENKQVYEAELSDLKNTIEKQEEKHGDTVAELERKFIEEKGRLQKESKFMLMEIKNTSTEEAFHKLNVAARKALHDNHHLAEELRVTSIATQELQKERTTLEDENKRLKLDGNIQQGTLDKYAQLEHKQAKTIRELNSKVKSLERSLSNVVKDFEREKQLIVENSKVELEEAKLEAAGLHQLVKMKTKEAKQIRKLARIILEQRSDVEQFLLDALAEVKEEKKKDSKRVTVQYQRDVHEVTVHRGVVKFPMILKDKDSNLPTRSDDKVDIKDLTWGDRERILRLLFAKINNSQHLQEAKESLEELETKQMASFEGSQGQVYPYPPDTAGSTIHPPQTSGSYAYTSDGMPATAGSMMGVANLGDRPIV